MLLGPITLIDCLVFLVFLVPQLLIQSGLRLIFTVALKTAPFFLWLPIEIIGERYWRHYSTRSAWAQGSSLFEDLVIRCVRHAFANIPPSVGGVFFSSKVSMPFIRWRMLRHGFWRLPVTWKEHEVREGDQSFRGIWMMHIPNEAPDLVLYYIHGGGFVLGSAYFYFEFLTSIHHLLLGAGFKNPAIFALEYTLAPKAVYPAQLNQAVAAYRHILELVKDPSIICISGDSAGGTIALSLLLELGARADTHQPNGSITNTMQGLPVPRSSVLLSPWVTIKSQLHVASDVDFLDREALWNYGSQYAHNFMDESPASPGNCRDARSWRAASPKSGFCVIYGQEEVFAGDIEDWMKRMTESGVSVEPQKFIGDCGIHAWPVVSLFLSDGEERRLKGLKTIVEAIRQRHLRVRDKAGKQA